MHTGDVEALSKIGVAEAVQCVGMNAGLFIGRDDIKLVTKRHNAEGELMTPGGGIERVWVPKGEERHDMALAICMDYIQAGYDVDGGAAPPKVVLLAATTPPVDDFYAKQRNFATVLANHAHFGGSTVIATKMDGLCFTEGGSTEKLPPGEGVLIVDYSGIATAPSTTFPPVNKIVYSAALLYNDDNREPPLTASLIASTLSSWNVAQYLNGSCNQYLETFTRHLNDGGSGESLVILARAVAKLWSRRGDDMDGESFALLTSHLLIDGVKSEPELRYWVLDEMRKLWVRYIDDENRPSNLGERVDLVLRRRDALDSRVRPSLRTAVRTDCRAGPRPPAAEADGAGCSTFFRARLIPRSEVDPVDTLPGQLDVLRALALESDDTVHLVYRLSTTERPSGGFTPVFDVVGVTEQADQKILDGLAEGIGAKLAAAFDTAWLLTTTPAGPFDTYPARAELRPVADTSLPIGEYWSALPSYLPRLSVPVSVQLACYRTEAKNSPGADNVTATLSTDGFLTSSDRRAAAFLRRSAEDDRDFPANLAVAVHISADGEVSDSVLRSIGVTLFGSMQFEIVRAQSAVTPILPKASQPVRAGLRPAEALRMFRPPHEWGKPSGQVLRGPTAIPVPASVNLPAQGIIVGSARTATHQSQDGVTVRLPDDARLRHMYVLGRTGSGKTNLLKTMARQDIEQNRGVAVIDPHGDLVDFLLGHVGGREDEVVLLDFGDAEYLPVLNPLDLDVAAEGGRLLAIEQFIHLLVRQSFHQSYGPPFEDLMRLALESITNRGYYIADPTILDVVRIFRTAKRRRWIHSILDDASLRERWRAFDLQGRFEIAQELHWALSKFSEMEQDGVLGHVLAGGRSSVSIDDVVRSGGILLVRMPEWEISRSTGTFLAAFIQERIRTAVYRRRATAGHQSEPFYLYVDEFQGFASSGFEELVAEARKFGLGLVLANQNMQQLAAFSRYTGRESTRLLETVMGNVANRIVFSASPFDAQKLAPEMGISPNSLHDPGPFQAVAQLLIDDQHHSFSVRTDKADNDPGFPDVQAAVRQRMIDSGRWRSLKNIRDQRADRDRRIRTAAGELFDPTDNDDSPLLNNLLHLVGQQVYPADAGYSRPPTSSPVDIAESEHSHTASPGVEGSIVDGRDRK